MSDFHIHIDALTLAPSFEQYLLRDWDFRRTDFSGHPEGAEAYEPPHHLTKKLASGKQFQAAFNELVLQAQNTSGMKGYIEGEFVALDEDIEERPFNPDVTIPCRVHTSPLPPGTFRESEIHIVFDRDRSDARLAKNLTQMGLFSAYLPKSYGIAQVFTAQGTRTDIKAVLAALLLYLRNCGGSVACSVKEERVARWWMSEAGVRLPPVIRSIEWAA